MINIKTINAELNNIIQNADGSTIPAAAQKAAGILKTKTQAAITAVGETKNGIKSLAQSDDGDIYNPPSAAETPCEITGDVAELKAELIKQTEGGATTSLAAITGASPAVAKLNKVITAGSPEAFAAALSKATGKPISEVQAAVAKTTDDPDQVSALATLEQSITQGIGAASKLTEDVTKLQTRVSNSLNEIVDDLFGNITLKLDKSITNTVTDLVGLLKSGGVAKEDIPEVDDLLRSISDEKHDDVIKALDKNNIIPKQALDATVRPLTLNPSKVVVEDKPPSIGEKSIPCYVIGSNEPLWKGANTPTIAKKDQRASSSSTSTGQTPFTFVDSKEELLADMENTTRSVTEVVVHWAGTYTNQDIGAEEIHEWHKQRGWSGIGYHFVIRRDGRLQRGRPLNKQGAHAGDNGHNKYSIGITFAAGYNCPSGTKNPNKFISADSITVAQMKTFDMFMSSFYKVWPGGQAFGHVDTDNKGKLDPGFSVPEYVLSKFGKTNLVASGKRPPLSPQQVATGRSDTNFA